MYWLSECIRASFFYLLVTLSFLASLWCSSLFMCSTHSLWCSSLFCVIAFLLPCVVMWIIFTGISKRNKHMTWYGKKLVFVSSEVKKNRDLSSFFWCSSPPAAQYIFFSQSLNNLSRLCIQFHVPGTRNGIYQRSKEGELQKQLDVVISSCTQNKKIIVPWIRWLFLVSSNDLGEIFVSL